MKDSYLAVTFRRGRAIAAYLYLPRLAGEKSRRTARVEPGLIIDFAPAGKPIGIEITAPGQVSISTLNKVLRDLGLSELKSEDLAPLCAA